MEPVIIILVYALIIAFVFYKSWKDRKKAKAGQAVFLDSLLDKMTVISNALAEINVNGKWEVTKEKEEATMSFQYQGGYFSIEISKRGNTARIVYPFFYGKSIVDILSLRTFINKINQSCGLAEVVYSCDTDKAEADLHIIVGLEIKTPASVYQPSTRAYYTPKDYIYDEGAKLVKVNNWGYLRFGPIRLFLSEAMADTRVEVRFAENDTFSIIYRNYKIATVDAVEGKLLDRHIRRL